MRKKADETYRCVRRLEWMALNINAKEEQTIKSRKAEKGVLSMLSSNG